MCTDVRVAIELKQKKLSIRHINLIHYTKKEKCDLCGLVVNTTEKLQAHMGKVHINKKILIL